MALNFKVPFGKSTPKQVPAQVAVPVPPAEVAQPADNYVHGDAIPVPEVVEKDSDSIWAMWTDAVNEEPENAPQPELELLPNILQADGTPSPATASAGNDPQDPFLATIPATMFMDLPDILKGRE